MKVSHADEQTAPVGESFLVDETNSAKLCSVSLPTFRRWVRDGVILPVALPNAVRRRLYRRSDLEAFVASLEQQA